MIRVGHYISMIWRRKLVMALLILRNRRVEKGQWIFAGGSSVYLARLVRPRVAQFLARQTPGLFTPGEWLHSSRGEQRRSPAIENSEKLPVFRSFRSFRSFGANTFAPRVVYSGPHARELLMRRIGKTARLPLQVRGQLNRRLQEGQPGKGLVAWLKGFAEANAVLAAESGRWPINQPDQGGSSWIKLDQAGSSSIKPASRGGGG